MTRKSKREIERELDKFDRGSDDEIGIILNLTWSGFDLEESPHPELTVQQWPDERPDSYSIAVPNVMPDAHTPDGGVLTVSGCKTAERRLSDAPFACDLWDSLTEEQLREEKRIREENDDPLPPILE